jgi:hypothetical protein
VLNRVLTVLCCAALGGCVPPAVSIASFAVDAFSYVVSGKSVSDHGLSLVMQEDCSVLKLVAGEAICAPGPHPEIRIAEPRDRDIHTYLASINAQSDAEERAHWSQPDDRALLEEYAAAGPLLVYLPIAATALILEPLASGTIDGKADPAVRLSSSSL